MQSKHLFVIQKLRLIGFTSFGFYQNTLHDIRNNATKLHSYKTDLTPNCKFQQCFSDILKISRENEDIYHLLGFAESDGFWPTSITDTE